MAAEVTPSPLPPLERPRGPWAGRDGVSWTAVLALGVGVFWLLFTITGNRPVWRPILVSDKNAGGAIRQLVFTGSVGLMLFHLMRLRAIGHVIAQRLPWIAFSCFMVGSVLWSRDPKLTIKRSIIFCFGTVVVLGLVHIPRKPVRFFQWAVLLLTGLGAWVALAAHVVLPKACTTIPIRPGLAGIAGHPNSMGPPMALGIVVSLGMHTRGWARPLARFLQGGLGIALLLTNSMTSTLMVPVALGIDRFLRIAPRTRGAIVITVLPIVLSVAMVGPSNVKVALLEAVGRDPSLSGRDELWAEVFHEGMKSPLFGSGYGAFWYEGRGREIVHTWNPRQSHNAYVDVFVDIGAIGALGLGLLLFGGLLTGWSRHRGVRGYPQRHAVSNLTAMSLALVGFYGGGESFLLKYDKFTFFLLVWAVLLVSNPDSNRPDHEFSEEVHDPGLQSAA